MKLAVRDAVLWLGDELIGPAEHVYLDTDYGKHYPAVAGVEVRRLPSGLDMAMVTVDGKTVAAEFKRLNDLCSSYRSRRLQRQLRTVRDVADIGIIGIIESELSLHEVVINGYKEAFLGLLKWQALGGLVGLLPSTWPGLAVTLLDWRGTLQPGRALWSVLAGDDRTAQRRKSLKGLPVCARVLVCLDVGIGPVLAMRVHEALHQDSSRHCIAAALGILNPPVAKGRLEDVPGIHSGIKKRLEALQ